MQKNILAVVIVATICICLQIGAGFTPMLYGRSLEEIKKSKEIRICLAGSSQDFYQKNARALVEYLGGGVQATFIRFKKWDNQFVNQQNRVRQDEEYTPEPLASGRCDLYPNDLARLDWLEKKMAFVPLFISRFAVIVNKAQENTYKEIKDLAGKTAAVTEDTAFHTWLKARNQGVLHSNPITLVFMPQEEAIKAVQSGNVDFTIAGVDSALYAIKNFAPHVHVAFPVGTLMEYGWYFNKKDTDLQELVRQFFEVQRSTLDSQINQNWKEHIGLSLGEFILFVTSTLDSAYN